MEILKSCIKSLRQACVYGCCPVVSDLNIAEAALLSPILYQPYIIGTEEAELNSDSELNAAKYNEKRRTGAELGVKPFSLTEGKNLCPSFVKTWRKKILYLLSIGSDCSPLGMWQKRLKKYFKGGRELFLLTKAHSSLDYKIHFCASLCQQKGLRFVCFCCISLSLFLDPR